MAALVRNEGSKTNGRIKIILKKLACICISILFMTVSAKATLVDSNSFIVVDNIEYYMQTNKSVYDLGENVEMLYRVTNLGDEDVTLGSVVSDSLAYYEFRIMQDGIQIWSYPYLSVVLGFTAFHLGPYESKEGQTIWNMMNDNGTLPTDDDFPVNPGIYDVIGELDLISGERVPVSVSIEIIPEPATILLLGLGVLLLKRRRFCPPTLSCLRWK
ncbi:MAG: PEP-CTERM sorting domain-containing protein [Planctomycetes bacterium]|nr:PEP-CTERM sorting domain-containing protein [Planctomycetota bacterium]